MGKSNALELLCNGLKNGRASLNSDFLIVVEVKGSFICYYSLDDDIIPQAPNHILCQKYEKKAFPPKVVFFSNVFDEKRAPLHREVADISLSNNYRRALKSRRAVSDFEKQIRLVNSKVFKSLDIRLPDKVQLLVKVWGPKFNFAVENSIRYTLGSRVRNFRKQFRERIRDITSKNKFSILFKFGFFFETLALVGRYLRKTWGEELPIFTHLDRLFDELEEIRSTEEICDRLISYLVEYFPADVLNKGGEVEISESGQLSYLGRFQEKIIFIQNLKSYASELDLEFVSEGARSTSLEYFAFSFQSGISRRFILEYTRLFDKSGIFDIDWLGISSGSKAYLNIFSSVYQELGNTRSSEVLLCIDEGDLYLHPQWQVGFFEKLITCIPQLFHGQVQLILTSHSPFLLSDLPRQNITILDSDAENATIDGVELATNTFGGNLYDLYSEPFFLGEKRTSDFAYRKIKEVIERVESGGLTPSERNEIANHLSIYGDEIIQFRLSNYLNK